MSIKKTSFITFVLGLVATVLMTTGGCGDNIHPAGMLPSPPDSSKDITQFTILGVDGAIAGTNIALTLPFGTDLTELTPTIVITGVSVSPDSGIVNDFTHPAFVYGDRGRRQHPNVLRGGEAPRRAARRTSRASRSSASMARSPAPTSR